MGARSLVRSLTATPGRAWGASFLVPAIVYFVPLLAAPERIVHPGPWIGFGAALVTLVTQPPLGPRQLIRDDRDRLSALGILAAAVVAQLVAMVEFVAHDPAASPTVSMLVGTGALLVSASLALRLCAIRALGRFFSSAVNVSQDHRLIDTGPYRLVRHPSYVGALGTQLGVCAVLGSAWGAAAVLALLAPAYAYRIRVEERALGDQLGSVYADYAARTWRVVPFVY